MSETYPKWKMDRCKHCALGMEISHRPGFHWTGNRNPPKCTAPSEEEYIAELEARLAEAEKDTARIDWCADNRIVDAIDDLDIDELTLAALTAREVAADCSEDDWRLEWRKQFRVAIDAGKVTEKANG